MIVKTPAAAPLAELDCATAELAFVGVTLTVKVVTNEEGLKVTVMVPLGAGDVTTGLDAARGLEDVLGVGT